MFGKAHSGAHLGMGIIVSTAHRVFHFKSRSQERSCRTQIHLVLQKNITFLTSLTFLYLSWCKIKLISSFCNYSLTNLMTNWRGFL